MTREEAIDILKDWDGYFIGHSSDDVNEALNMAIKALEQEPTIKALGEELRKARQGIADEKVLIGYNMAVAICNKHLGESKVEDGNET